MVKLEIINDDVDIQTQEQKFDNNANTVESDDDYSDDEFDVNETFVERIIALQDIVPPHYRAKVSNTFGDAYNVLGTAFSLGGSGLWILTSATLLLGIPFGLCLAGEEQLNELENNLSTGGSAENMLAPEGETKKLAA